MVGYCIDLGRMGRKKIKFSLHTRDPRVACLRNLEVLAKIERARSPYDVVAVSAATRSIVPIHSKCKTAPSAISTG